MFMLKKTHLLALARVEHDHSRTRDALDTVRQQRDRVQADNNRLYSCNVLLTEQIANFNSQIRQDALKSHAEQVAHFKWGAEPAPMAQQAHKVDLMTMPFGGGTPRRVSKSCPNFPEISPDWLDKHAGPCSARGRMPGAGSVSFPETTKE